MFQLVHRDVDTCTSSWLRLYPPKYAKKNDWKTKILDEKIALEWLVEVGFANRDDRFIREGRAKDAISDLRRSALALTTLESDILLGASDNSLEPFDMNTIEADLKNSLKYARGSTYALPQPELKESGLGIIVSDDLVPPALHQEVRRQLDALAAKEPQDFHPGSFGKVQDLIDPSLYPYIVGTTPPFKKDSMFHARLRTKLSTQDMMSLYASIPSVFRISPDGMDAHIDSYINGLGTREQYPGLFRVIEKMFLLALPHFENTLKQSAKYAKSTAKYSSSDRREFAVEKDDKLTRQMWTQYLEEQSPVWDAQWRAEKEAKEKLQEDIRQEECIKTTFYDLGDEFVASEQYKGKELKVIVKAANYTLRPGQEYKESWHMEGMPHEQIVASVIYYYDDDGSIQDDGLDFRKFRDTVEDFPHVGESDPKFSKEDFYLTFTTDDKYDEEDHYPSDWEMELRKVPRKSREDDDEYEDYYPSDTESYDEEMAPISPTDLPRFIELGTVPTTNIQGSNGTGRMISFPNWLSVCIPPVFHNPSSCSVLPSIRLLELQTQEILLQAERLQVFVFLSSSQTLTALSSSVSSSSMTRHKTSRSITMDLASSSFSP
ncbi:hypothetical protein BDP27DRAFT_1427550 [Rhodocollybia butyracea]|uniref:DUF4246 domain-containing protein n=1 Tax=Rhodocollybia butyracea TaxID=206335 RepID=A0A9P5PHK1_9AGAR|nr:hypothetical protein BDP27DRAFT_1427550 [Rhodocollybia butyracea]